MVEAVNEVANAGILGSLGIDWKIFLAQLINFGLVLVVLWKWAYTPLVKMLEKRQLTIEESLTKAKEIDDRLAKVAGEAEAQLKKAREEAKKILEEATVAAQAIALDEKRKANETANKILKTGQAELEKIKSEIVSEARGELAGLVALALQKIISEKMSAKENEALVQKTLEAIKGYGG
ncbi:MAG: F0F1 ATP synthase subunit B [bacterium]